MIELCVSPGPYFTAQVEHPGPAHDGRAQRRCRRIFEHSNPSIYDNFVATCLSSAGRPGRPRRRRRPSWRKPRTPSPKRSAQQVLSSSRPRSLRRLPRSGAGTRATAPCPWRPGGGGKVRAQEVLHQGVELEQNQGQARRLPGIPRARVDRAGCLRYSRALSYRPPSFSSGARPSRSPTCSGKFYGDDCSRAPHPHGRSHRRHGSPR